MYITYKEYTSLGGKLDVDSFERLAFKASRVIDLHTHSRLKDVSCVPQAVKYACTELVDFMSEHTDGGTVKSFSTDGYSESRGGAAEISAAQEDIIYSYLAEVCVNGVPLLYKGVDC